MSTRSGESRGKASVVWELSEADGVVVVDVDAPLRPFGSMPTPAKGIKKPPKDETEPDGAPVADAADLPQVPKP